MHYQVKPMGLDKVKTDILILPVWKGLKQQPELQELNEIWGGAILSWLQQSGFEGNKKELIVLPCLGVMPIRSILFVGLGDRKATSLDDLRVLGGLLSKKCRELKAKHTTFISEPLQQAYRMQEAAQAWIEGWMGGSYFFGEYHAEHQKKHKEEAVTECLWITHGTTSIKAVEKGLELGERLMLGVYATRDLVNTIPHELTPQMMAKEALTIAEKQKRVSCTILDKKQMEKRGMGAALAVGRGSAHEPVLVHLVYKPAQKAKKRIALVGKAVTFDTGGLSLKPTEGMVTMKCDMAGAGAVLGLFHSISSLELDVEVHGIFIAVENALSANSYRPGDVVKAMNGTTIDIQNTDAEGRVVLADALCYAKELEPQSIVDLATLTGACIVALGEDIAGIMGTDQKLVDRLMKAGKEAGEDLWQLPLPDKYADHIKSKIAMIKNLGAKGQAGTIAGGLFLKHFVGTTPWAHLDIAGPAWTDSEKRPDMSYGGTGFGVRLLARYLQGL